jgi:hypothetical protein
MLKGGSVLKSLVKALGFALYERKRSIGFIIGLAFSGAAFALGMGGINVITALGEPLKADIELVAVSSAQECGLGIPFPLTPVEIQDRDACRGRKVYPGDFRRAYKRAFCQHAGGIKLAIGQGVA